MLRVLATIVLALAVAACEPDATPHRIYIGTLNSSDYKCVQKIAHQTAVQQGLPFFDAGKEALKSLEDGDVHFMTLISQEKDHEKPMAHVVVKGNKVTIFTYRVGDISDDDLNYLAVRLDTDIEKQCGVKFKLTEFSR